MQFLYFTVNETWLALDIIHVDEILMPDDPNIKALDKKQISGVIRHGDDKISLLNLREHLFGKARSADKDFRIIVCSIDGRKLALQVDSTEEIAMVDPNEISDADKSGIDFNLNFTEGVIREENRTIYILSPGILTAIPKKA